LALTLGRLSRRLASEGASIRITKAVARIGLIVHDMVRELIISLLLSIDAQFQIVELE